MYAINKSNVFNSLASAASVNFFNSLKDIL